MNKSKQLSSPSATGGIGVQFEARVQASFVVLMLTGGYAPCLPCLPIVEVKLQGKIDGYDTDDMIVTIEDPDSKKQRKLLGQIKHAIDMTNSSNEFSEVMKAAWNDFNNPEVFTRGKDVIALITGSLTRAVIEVTELLEHARSNDYGSFFSRVATPNFISGVKREKLEVIRHHLTVANCGTALTDEELHAFLNHFHLLQYDLSKEEGVVLSLINSHISQFKPENPRFVWSRVLELISTKNPRAGSITKKNIPEDLTSIFSAPPPREIPADLARRSSAIADWTSHPESSLLALAVLIGSWQDETCDPEVITQLLGIGEAEWQKKVVEIQHHPDSPLSFKNGTWKIARRAELFSQLGSRILNSHLDTFKKLAVSVLGEQDPSFELAPEMRYAASLYGKALKYSPALRRGIAEGLAILGSQPQACPHCSQGKVTSTCEWVVRELLPRDNWVLWGSLSTLLPTLAEAAPEAFLPAVSQAMSHIPSPFDTLFSQESDGITGTHYLTGLVGALETLAWDEQYLVRVCTALAELADHNPVGHSANRPLNSLVTILLPWLPQTHAPFEKHKVAVQRIRIERSDVAWRVIIQLLPEGHQSSSGSHKPSWRNPVPNDWKTDVTHREYWQQITFYSELALSAAGQDVARLSALIERFHDLPEPTFSQLLEHLASPAISGLTENQRLPIWDSLRKFTEKHREFPDAAWVLPNDQLVRIEQVAQKLMPLEPLNLYQHHFTHTDRGLCDDSDTWEVQQKQLDSLRDSSISDIFHQQGVEGAIRFAESVVSPEKAGRALGSISDLQLEAKLLPHFIDSTDHKRKKLVSNFISRRYERQGWQWCDALDKSSWTPEQIGQFLAELPRTQESWSRASQWLGNDEREYWSRTSPYISPNERNFGTAVDKLIENGRPLAAITCLAMMLTTKRSIDSHQCSRALLAAVSSSESKYTTEAYDIVKLIQFLQTEPSVNQDELFNVEWAYVPLLNQDTGAAPQLLERKLTNEPAFFCEMIQLSYRSNKENQPLPELSKETEAIATNAWRLLSGWRTPPGMQLDQTFNADDFNQWLKTVEEICTQSGHWEAAQRCIGKVLLNAPPDPSGLWMHKAVAEALNKHEANHMRNGFRIATHNSRGVPWVDPTGRPETELAEQSRLKAEKVENAGFHRLAVTLRQLATDYDRQAESRRREAM